MSCLVRSGRPGAVGGGRGCNSVGGLMHCAQHLGGCSRIVGCVGGGIAQNQCDIDATSMQKPVNKDPKSVK